MWHESLRKTLEHGVEVESNTYYVIWLLCRFGGKQVSSGRLCDPALIVYDMDQFNWKVEDGHVVDQVTFVSRQ